MIKTGAMPHELAEEISNYADSPPAPAEEELYE